MFYLKKFYFIIYILLMCRRSMFVRFIVRVAPQSVFSCFTDAITVCLDCKEVRNSLVCDWSVTLMRTITSFFFFFASFLMFGVLNAYMHAYCCPYVHTLHVFPLSEVHSSLLLCYVRHYEQLPQGRQPHWWEVYVALQCYGYDIKTQ